MTKKEVIVPADDLVCLGKDKLQELIRCKDCKYSKAYYNGPESKLGMFTYLCTYGLCVMAEDYCSRAERKSSNE